MVADVERVLGDLGIERRVAAEALEDLPVQGSGLDRDGALATGRHGYVNHSIPSRFIFL